MGIPIINLTNEPLIVKPSIYIGNSWQVLTSFQYQTAYDFRMAGDGDSLIPVENEYSYFSSRQSL